MKKYILIAGVKSRVSKGGHGIPEVDIEKRYIETFHNLKDILKDCDLAAFYDNTEEFRRFAIFGVVKLLDCHILYPNG